MGGDRVQMEQNAAPVFLNIGCGTDKIKDMVNVDAYGDPDVRWDLNKTPWPWADNSVDGVLAKHVFEHLENWWGAFQECGRILKPGGQLDIRVPDESSSSALTFRDHLRVFGPNSFCGIIGTNRWTNAWAMEPSNFVPFKLVNYQRVPFPQYAWMTRWPFHWLMKFCADHLRNFIWEQRLTFIKIG